MKGFARVSISALVALLLAWAVAAAELAAARHARRAVAVAARMVSAGDDSFTPPIKTPQSAPERERPLYNRRGRDLSGNEVDDAMAEYALDESGSLYEMHAPQVELPRLPSPKS